MFLKELSRCERNSLQLLLLLSGPQTGELLSSKQSSTGHECWLLSLEGNDPNKEMCLFSVPDRAKSK